MLIAPSCFVSESPDAVESKGTETAETTQGDPIEMLLSEEEKAHKFMEFYRALEEDNGRTEDFEQISDGILKDVNYKDCSVAVLEANGPKIYGWLSEEKLEEFIDCITHAEIAREEIDELPKVAGGSAFQFKIVLSTDKIIYIRQLTSIIIINERGYPCDEESLRLLQKIHSEIYNNFLEEALQQ